MSWSRAGGQPRFLWVLDWRVSMIFLFFIAHMRMWVFWTLLCVAGSLSLLSHFGYTLPVFYRRLRSRMAGSVRAARPWWWRRRFVR